MKKTFDASSRALPHIQDLHAYVPGEQPQGEAWVKLNTNENPYPPSPKVTEAVALEVENLRKYPEPTSVKLRALIGTRYGLEQSNVIIGNGSDNILDLITRCLCLIRAQDTRCPVIPLPSGSRHVGAGLDRRQFRPLHTARRRGTGRDAGKVFFLTNPNAPTGVAFPFEQIEGLWRRSTACLWSTRPMSISAPIRRSLCSMTTKT